MTKSPTAKKSTILNDPFATVIPLIDFENQVEPEKSESPNLLTPPAIATNNDVNIEQAERVIRKPSQQIKPVQKLSNKPVTPLASDRQPAKKGKQKLTVHLDIELADRVKNAAYWNPRLTIAGIAEQGIRQIIEKVEREHGGKYPPREGELVGGRPIK